MTGQGTGVCEIAGMDIDFVYTEEPEDRTEPDYYRVEAVVDYVNKAAKRNIYFIPPRQLEDFLRMGDSTAERIVKIQEATSKEKEAVVSSYSTEGRK